MIKITQHSIHLKLLITQPTTDLLNLLSYTFNCILGVSEVLSPEWFPSHKSYLITCLVPVHSSGNFQHGSQLICGFGENFFQLSHS